MTIFLIFFIIGVLALLAWVIYKMTEIDEIKEDLDKYSVYLDERANKLALWEQELIRWEEDAK